MNTYDVVAAHGGGDIGQVKADRVTVEQGALLFWRSAPLPNDGSVPHGARGARIRAGYEGGTPVNRITESLELIAAFGPGHWVHVKIKE